MTSSNLLLELTYRERVDRLVYLNVEPMADPIRSDARFAKLMTKVGFRGNVVRCRRFVGRTRKARLTSAGMPWLQISSDSASYKLYYVN